MNEGEWNEKISRIFFPFYWDRVNNLTRTSKRLVHYTSASAYSYMRISHCSCAAQCTHESHAIHGRKSVNTKAGAGLFKRMPLTLFADSIIPITEEYG